jgi:hypothetical protein
MWVHPPILEILHLLDSNCPQGWWRFPRSTRLLLGILLIGYLYEIDRKRKEAGPVQRKHLSVDGSFGGNAANESQIPPGEQLV